VAAAVRHHAWSEAPAASSWTAPESVAIGRKAALQPVARPAEQRFRIRRREIAEHPAVGEEHKEWVGVARVLIVDVRGQIDRRIGPELFGDVDRDGLREAFRLAGQRRARARHDPHEQHALHDEHRGERHDEADRDAPVKAAIPALGAGG
jgi:hypothetical protein